MSREKQIEENELQEFVITLSDCQHGYDKECTKAIVTKTDMPKANKFYAKYLMEHGYHKQSEGEWIDQYNGKYDNPIYVCSLCRKGTLLKPDIDELGNMKMIQALSTFCPNCGAKMKGDNNG